MSTRLIIGADEVGYGAIAGSLVAAAVAFESSTRQPVLKRFQFERGKDVPVQDSKKVDQRLLHRLSDLVREKCVGYELCLKSCKEIERLGAPEAKFAALRAAIQRLIERLTLELPGLYENYRVIVDGETDLGACRFNYRAQAGADQTVWQVGAASLLAKDAQVKLMLNLHNIYNKYGWDKNKGYPTKDHIKALREHGVTEYHRRSYRPVKEILDAY